MSKYPSINDTQNELSKLMVKHCKLTADMSKNAQKPATSQSSATSKVQNVFGSNVFKKRVKQKNKHCMSGDIDSAYYEEYIMKIDSALITELESVLAEILSKSNSCWDSETQFKKYVHSKISVMKSECFNTFGSNTNLLKQFMLETKVYPFLEEMVYNMFPKMLDELKIKGDFKTSRRVIQCGKHVNEALNYIGTQIDMADNGVTLNGAETRTEVLLTEIINSLIPLIIKFY